MISRKIDSFGRIVIPKEMRESLNMKKGSSVDFTLYNGGILVRSGGNSCKICGKKCESENVFHICEMCLKEIREA